jgi:hypothetical protein|tara:strand:+ start:36 stop:410 length:375 start_codon:yes stop_codon:yes gene_type:complete
MRDLSNPLAPSIFKGEGRKRRQAKRMEKKENRNWKNSVNEPKRKAKQEKWTKAGGKTMYITHKEHLSNYKKKSEERIGGVREVDGVDYLLIPKPNPRVVRRKKSGVPKSKYKNITNVAKRRRKK